MGRAKTTLSLGVLTIHLHLPGCTSLKEKRSRLKPLLARLHREFNISVAEMGHLDSWQDSLVTCALVSNDHAHTQRALQQIVSWIEKTWPDVEVVDDQLEFL
jgi:uncharacterized protein YlxP (DUF503 family)